VLGQGHIGGNVGLEDCDSVSSYGFTVAKGNTAGNDAGECVVQGRGGTNPRKKKITVKKKQEVDKVMTPRNKNSAKPAWIEHIPKKVIPESARVEQDKLKGFVKDI
jgi:hypothetical protein